MKKYLLLIVGLAFISLPSFAASQTDGEFMDWSYATDSNEASTTKSPFLSGDRRYAIQKTDSNGRTYTTTGATANANTGSDDDFVGSETDETDFISPVGYDGSYSYAADINSYSGTQYGQTNTSYQYAQQTYANQMQNAGYANVGYANNGYMMNNTMGQGSNYVDMFERPNPYAGTPSYGMNTMTTQNVRVASPSTVQYRYPVQVNYPIQVQQPVTVQPQVTVQRPVMVTQPIVVQRPIVVTQPMTVQQSPMYVTNQPMMIQQAPVYTTNQPMMIQQPMMPMAQAPVYNMMSGY